ncbi:MAG TPA: ABC-2 family transporter protein [Clostridia bacterium]|nr:ABC-2 family transporter protein [Clostridia bacterium]
MKQLVSNIRHYFRVYSLLIKLSLRSVFVYRVNTLVMGLAPIVWMATMLVFIGIIFSKVKQLGGWTLWEVVFLTGVHELIFLLSWTTIVTNLKDLGYIVKTGRLDQELLRPLNPKFLVSFKTLDFANIGGLVNTILIFSFSIGKVSDKIQPGRIGGFLLLLAFSYLICYFIYFLFGSLSLFFVSASSFLNWLFEMTDFDRYPAEIYPLTMKIFLTFFLPLLFLAYIPTAYLLGKISAIYILEGGILMGFFYLITRILWQLGLKRYQSASS